MKNTLLQKKNEFDFEYIIADLISNSTVQKMSTFRQHYNTSCLDHCRNVAFYNYIICKKFNLDYISAARAGLLHDLFLYDWRKPQPGRKRLHAFFHPRVALINAKRLFDLNKKEEDIILKHMWPLTVVPPKYTESYITTFVDKFCTLLETYQYYNDKVVAKRAFRYAYLFLSLLIIPVI